jgi:hypothetical protein
VGGVRPAELAIKLRIEELPGVNAYTLYGAKIRLYSVYSSAANAEEVLRGEFWVTSVSRLKTIYTIKASDALIWLESGSYNDAGATGKAQDNPIYQYCVSWVRTLSGNFSGVIDYVNATLTACDVDNITYVERTDIVNQQPNGIGFALLPVDIAGSSFSRSPRDYASFIAAISAGCVQMLTDPADPDVRKLYLTPYAYTPEGSDSFCDMWSRTIDVPYSTITADSCDVADYTVYIQSVYFKAYNERAWSCHAERSKHAANTIIDLSGNPFVDGRYYNFNSDLPNSPYDVTMWLRHHFHNNDGETFTVRPFAVRCHPQFASCADYPKLGQRIRIEVQPDIWQESIITKMAWKFRGGWEFGCAGKDSRLLSQAAKKSLAKHSEEAAKTYANIGINGVRSTAEAAQSTAKTALDGLNAAITTYNNNFDGIWERLNRLENQ